jgi:AAA15 family ATPase/GTPase
MNSIGLKNFRKFKNLPNIELSSINFLVGTNNSGKSTLVRSMLLLDQYFELAKNSGDWTIFPLSLPHSRMGQLNFGRALNSEAKMDDEKTIEFSGRPTFLGFRILISEEEEAIQGRVLQIEIENKADQQFFRFDFQSRQFVFRRPFTSVNKVLEDNNIPTLIEKIKALEKEIEDLEKKDGFRRSDRQYIELLTRRDKISNQLSRFEKNITDYIKEDVFEIIFDFQDEVSPISVLNSLNTQKLLEYDLAFKSIQNGETEPPDFEQLRWMKEVGTGHFVRFIKIFNQSIFDSKRRFIGRIQNYPGIVIPVTSNQGGLGKLLEEYSNYRIQKGELPHRFIETWLQKFGIGDSFEIESISGEAYLVKIFNEKSASKHLDDLADLGTGSIHIVYILFELSLAIYHQQKISERMHREVFQDSGKDESGSLSNIYLYGRYNVEVYMEEPESNLHPALQSLLSDLFYEVSTRYYVWLMVETHSEYLIRRSQVISAMKGLSGPFNPFKVFYFPAGLESPYELVFLPDGTFERSFGPGFFDEASASTLELIRLKRQPKN